MASINFATREINCKIVYYGPGLSGKTTNLQVIHQKLPRDKKSEMVSLATDQDRTLFFDFLPLDLGSIKGFKTKFQLYTVPGQVYYNSTRKLVLRGVDGVVFVADSQKNRMAENLESLQNLKMNLIEQGVKLEDLPFVMQYNKRDLEGALDVPVLEERLNPFNADFYEATAHDGLGVVLTLKAVARKVINRFNKKSSSAPSTAPIKVKAAVEAPKPVVLKPKVVPFQTVSNNTEVAEEKNAFVVPNKEQGGGHFKAPASGFEVPSEEENPGEDIELIPYEPPK
jgi:signal recognition particle receptor subunit beta